MEATFLIGAISNLTDLLNKISDTSKYEICVNTACNMTGQKGGYDENGYIACISIKLKS